MGRGKARWNLIDDKSSRRATFEKRRKGVEKKAHELATLCDVKIGIIMYGPSDSENPTEPLIWPDDQDLISSMIKAYREKPQENRSCRSSNVIKFFQERTLKVEEEMEKLRKRNHELKYPTWDASYENLSYDEIVRFGHRLDAILSDVNSKIGFLKGTYAAQYYHQRWPGMFSSIIEGPGIQENGFMVKSEIGYQGESMAFSSLEMPQNSLEGQAVEEKAIMTPGFQNYLNESIFFNPLAGQGMQEMNAVFVEGNKDYQGEIMAFDSLWDQEIQNMIADDGKSMVFPTLQESSQFVQHMNTQMRVDYHPTPAANNMGILDHFNVMSSPSYSQMTMMGDESFNNGLFSTDQMPVVMDNNALDGVHGAPSMDNYVPMMYNPVPRMPLFLPGSLVSDIPSNMIVGSQCTRDIPSNMIVGSQCTRNHQAKSEI